MELPLDVKIIKDIPSLIEKAKWLEGKSLAQVSEAIKKSDTASRVTTKGAVGHLIEKGFFGIEQNVGAKPDIEHLGVEIKTSPIKYNSTRNRLSVKEPLSLNLIDYSREVNCKDIKESSLFQKNGKTLFVWYIHEGKQRSEYLIQYVFLWEMDENVLDELRPDYNKIIDKIRLGRAHEIHQTEHDYLTLCPKHGGRFKDPYCMKSKRGQPFSEKPAEIRAFRLKNKYMNIVISRYLGKTLGKGGWPVGP